MVPDGETVLFAEDALVIVPGPDTAVDVAMQYRVFGYSGATPPSLDWQDAMHVTWRGEAQWCFMLPRGRMSVEVRAVNRVSGGVSGSSEAMKFLVKGMVLVVAKKLQSEFYWCTRRARERVLWRLWTLPFVGCLCVICFCSEWQLTRLKGSSGVFFFFFF